MILKDAFLAGLGLVSLTKDKAQEITQELIKRGELAKNDENDYINKMMKAADEQKARFKERINEEVEKILKSSNLVTRSEYENLKKRVDELENKLKQSEGN